MTRDKIPKRKISATVLEFGEPLLGLLEEPTVEEFRAALNIVIAAWNVHGVSMGTGNGDNRYLDELARFRRQIADEGAPAEMLAGFDALNARRVAEYGDDPRCVSEWDLVPDDLGATNSGVMRASSAVARFTDAASHRMREGLLSLAPVFT